MYTCPTRIYLAKQLSNLLSNSKQLLKPSCIAEYISCNNWHFSDDNALVRNFSCQFHMAYLHLPARDLQCKVIQTQFGMELSHLPLKILRCNYHHLMEIQINKYNNTPWNCTNKLWECVCVWGGGGMDEDCLVSINFLV